VPWRLQVTGKEFDIDPKSFTLGSMFAMRLDKFTEDILKITSAAEKELTIENELKKLVEVWREQKFTLAKYVKGTEDRGWILRSVEDVTLLLEDLGLNLQSMMASPFVRPFIDEVRKWEQKLSLIGETTEAWMQVQRKWMYLESIFGSDDIRLQLPQVRRPHAMCCTPAAAPKRICCIRHLNHAPTRWQPYLYTVVSTKRFMTGLRRCRRRSALTASTACSSRSWPQPRRTRTCLRRARQRGGWRRCRSCLRSSRCARRAYLSTSTPSAARSRASTSSPTYAPRCCQTPALHYVVDTQAVVCWRASAMGAPIMYGTRRWCTLMSKAECITAQAPVQDELLSILGTSDPTSVQEHMLKLFDNCATLTFARGNKSVVGMTSSEGESFDFRQAVAIEGAAETWMTAVEREMKDTLYQISKEGVFYYAKKPRDKWIAGSLGMVTLAGSQIWWTWETEDTFQRVQAGNKHAMKAFLAKQNAQLAQLTGMVRTDLAGQTRKKVNQVIIVEVHARDIVDSFVRDSIMDARCAAAAPVDTWLPVRAHTSGRRARLPLWLRAPFGARMALTAACAALQDIVLT
jgi:Dynein heavy chain, N-terminal region 2